MKAVFTEFQKNKERFSSVHRTFIEDFFQEKHLRNVESLSKLLLPIKRKEVLTSCALCLKTDDVILANSHIITDALQCLIDKKWVPETNNSQLVGTAKNLTYKAFLCSSSRGSKTNNYAGQSCEESLSKYEDIVKATLAGQSWKKEDGPYKNLSDGWILQANKLLQPSTSIKLTYSHDFLVGIASLFYRQCLVRGTENETVFMPYLIPILCKLGEFVLGFSELPTECRFFVSFAQESYFSDEQEAQDKSTKNSLFMEIHGVPSTIGISSYVAA